MSQILQFFASFCVAAIFIGALFTLCPDGAMSKTVKYALSLVFMCTVISAAGITVSSDQIVLEEPHSFTQEQYEMEIAFARQVYGRALTGKGINFKGIEVFTNKLKDGSIVINKIAIKTNASRSEVLSALEGLDSNIEVEIIND